MRKLGAMKRLGAMKAGALAKCAVPIALMLLLQGCVSLGGDKAPPTLFRLSATQAPAAGSSLSGKASDAIVVLDPDTDRSIAVTRIMVQVDDSNIAYLTKAQWVERPSHMFAALMAETVRAGGKHLVFTADEAVTVLGSRLGGRLMAFGYDAREQSAVVRYDAVLTAPGGVVSTKRFEAKIPGVAATPESVGPALNRAANQVAAQVSDWLG